MKAITRALLVLSVALLPLLSACASDPTGTAAGHQGLEQDCIPTGTQVTCGPS